jgi:hypothetical protein
VSDITAEKLARVMAENFGRVAVMNAEGDFLRVLGGRYSSGQVNLEILKKGWTGDEPFRDDRVGRDGTYVRNPLIVLGMAFQPTLLETLGNANIFDGEGVFARFLYAVPGSNLGNRKTGEAVPPLDRRAARSFDTNLQLLLDSPPASVDEKKRTWVPYRLQFSEEAKESFNAFEAEVERMLRPDGELSAIEAWGGKLVGNVARISGIVHLASLRAENLPWEGSKVSKASVDAAISIGRALITHAHVVFGDVLETNQRLRLARYFFRRIKELAVRGPLHEQDLFQACKGKKNIRTMPDLRGLLRFLESRELVRVIKQDSTGGRPRSGLVLLNPKATEDIPKRLKSPSQDGGKEGDK